VVCSHLHGGIVPMREVVEIARKHGIGVVEDAAQAPGATVQGRPAGTWGDVGTLSFGGSKLLAAGRGGALLVRDPQLFQRAKLWLHRGLQQWAPLSELQAAALRPQLAKLREATAHRAAVVRHLSALVAQAFLPVQNGSTGRNACATEDGAGLVPFENTAADSVAAYYKVGFRFDPEAFGLSRDLFVKALRAEGIAFDAGFNALHVGRSPSRFRAVGALTHATAAHHGCVVLHHPVLAGPPADAQQVADAVARVHRHRDAIRPAVS
jgi:dTDP-4-amino-4,6-dideoxygalactose transaminase